VPNVWTMLLHMEGTHAPQTFTVCVRITSVFGQELASKDVPDSSMPNRPNAYGRDLSVAFPC
jgi:hypothetical protein